MFFADRPAARENWRRDANRLLTTLGSPEGWMACWGTGAGADDARSWEVAFHLAAGTRDAMTDGDDGWWDDWTATLTP